MYLDALVVQLPSVYGLQYWVLDPQFSTSFTLLVNRRGTDRFPSTITLILQCLPDLPPGTAGTAGDPRWNVPKVPSDIPPCCLYSWLAACSCQYFKNVARI